MAKNSIPAGQWATATATTTTTSLRDLVIVCCLLALVVPSHGGAAAHRLRHRGGLQEEERVLEVGDHTHIRFREKELAPLSATMTNQWWRANQHKHAGFGLPYLWSFPSTLGTPLLSLPRSSS